MSRTREYRREKVEEGYKFEGTLFSYLKDAPDKISSSGKIIRQCEFLCRCGNVKIAGYSLVKRAKVKSCGCLRDRKSSERMTKHSLSSTKAYVSYHEMLKRCYNEDSTGYKWYGAKGIQVCERWLGDHGLLNFIADMGQPTEGGTLDRINPKLGYFPENCRWASKSVQAYNKGKSSRNKSGRTGVRLRDSGYYESYITVDSKFISLVHTRDFDLAVFCREEAEMHFYGHIKE